MEKTAEQLYTDLLRQLASPSAIPPGVLADAFREAERMHAGWRQLSWPFGDNYPGRSEVGMV